MLDRYISIVIDSGEVFRFIERNQASRRDTDGGKHRFTQFRPRLNALVEVVTGPGAPPRSRIRARRGHLRRPHGVHVLHDGRPGARRLIQPRPLDSEELRKIVLELADDLARDIAPA